MRNPRDLIGVMGILLIIGGLACVFFDLPDLVGGRCDDADIEGGCATAGSLVLPGAIAAAVGLVLFACAAFVLKK